jgi:predicted SnoaL-like aldol condensation-catalyzing enzyme
MRSQSLKQYLLWSLPADGPEEHLYTAVDWEYHGHKPLSLTIVAEKGGRPMSEEENKALVRRFIEHDYQEAMRGNLDVVHQYFADHYHDHTPLHPEQPGVHGVKELIADTGQATPDLRMEVVHIAADGDLVFVHWQATGTHERQHQVTRHVRHLEPSGEEETVSGVILYRIEGDKFVEGWNYHNILEHAHARGMGAAPASSS